jgi:hypothetical protein
VDTPLISVAVAVQVAAPVTDHDTLNGVLTFTGEAALKAKFGGCGASGGPDTVAVLCAPPLEFEQVTPNV